MRASRPLWRIAAALGALHLGCVQALKEPPPIAQLAGAEEGQVSPADASELLQEAELLYAKRALPEIREAVRLFLQTARNDSTRVESLVGAAKAQVWIVDHESDAGARDQAAVGAVQAAQWCQRSAAENAACDFWLGAALGMQAREKHSTALDALHLIEAAFRRAAQKDPTLEEAGPHRALALLYARAPGWPTGPGDPDRALAEARKAVELRPDYPPNQLALGEALALTKDSQDARSARTRALELARQRKAAGDPDAGEWIREAQEALTRKPNFP